MDVGEAARVEDGGDRVGLIVVQKEHRGELVGVAEVPVGLDLVPRVATHQAQARLQFPDPSANLVRALPADGVAEVDVEDSDLLPR